MKGIKEKSFELFPEMHTDSDDWDVIEEQCDRDKQRKAFVNGANYVLDIVEKELARRMLEDYNQGAEEDEVAQGCMSTMIMFVRQLKK